MRLRGTRCGGDDRLPRCLQPVHPWWADEARLTPVTSDRRRGEGSIVRPSIVRRWREHGECLVRRRSTWIQLATRRGTERNTGRLEITLEADRHHGGIGRGRLQ